MSDCTNLIVTRLAQGLPVAMLGVRMARSAEVARLAKASGNHALWIDLEHSAMGIDVAAQICATANDIGVVPLVRITEHDRGVIGRLLDGGAMGIIAPRIETVQQARELVADCRFPPLGSRSSIGMLAAFEYRRMPAAELMTTANHATLVEVLVESPLGIANIEAIARVEGVDIVGVGVNDLSAELGVPGDFRHASVQAALQQALEGCQRAGKPLAIGGIPDAALNAEWVRRGAAPFLMTGVDTDLLLAAAQARVREALASLT